ncbi:MAG: hypothetical protein J1F11_05545 [Oscillospiraceae bacterium]|nr:hypothetical protein [Oscillospiraceae bacterium]
MALSNEYIDAVSNNKMTRVRIMLKDIMLVDPSMSKFDEMIAYAEKNMTGIYDRHDGEEFLNVSSDWTEDYMNQQMVSVVSNFSKERVALLKNIVKHLYGSKISQDTGSQKSSNGASSNANNSSPTTKQIAGGVITVVGAGAIVGGIVASNVPIAIVGGVSVVGGIALMAAKEIKGG